MSPIARKLAFVLAIGGLIVSLDAAYLHYRLLFDPLYTSFCDISATVSCTQVYASRFGTAFGVPVSVFGAIWFTGAVLLLVGAEFGPRALRDNVPGYLFALSTVGLYYDGRAYDLAQGTPATQSSSTQTNGQAAHAVDGNTDGNFFDNSATHTLQDASPWWQVDLGASRFIDEVEVWNRTDCCSTRLRDYYVFLSDVPFNASDTIESLTAGSKPSIGTVAAADAPQMLANVSTSFVRSTGFTR